MRDLSLHLLDIIQNSVTAGAGKIDLLLSTANSDNQLIIVVKDNGMGMDEELLKKVTDPFTTTRTTRKVGLGIPLFSAAARMSAGSFAIRSEKGLGTTVTAAFQTDHIDRPPLGSISETLSSQILAKPEIEYELIMENKTDRFVFNSFAVQEQLGEVPINNFDVLSWIGGYIDEGVKAIFGGVLDEING